MTKKERQALFAMLGIQPSTEEQAARAQERLEAEARRIRTWLANANRPRPPRDFPKVDIDLS